MSVCVVACLLSTYIKHQAWVMFRIFANTESYRYISRMLDL
jgi:hypothetical protein